MLRTPRERYVEVDGRTAGRTIVLKVRDLAGRRLEAADVAARHRQLEEQVASLRGLLDEAHRADALPASPGRSARRASGASTGWPRPSPCSSRSSG